MVIKITISLLKTTVTEKSVAVLQYYADLN